MARHNAQIIGPGTSTLRVPAGAERDNWRGLKWMLISVLASSIMALAARFASQELDSRLVVLARGVLTFASMLVLFAVSSNLRSKLHFTDLRAHLIRGVLIAISTQMGFYTISVIPLATSTVLFFTAPIFATILAVFLHGEAIGPRRIAAILAGFAGVLIILRPGFRVLSIGHVAMIGAALFFAGSYLIAKLMSGKFSAPVVVGMLSITVTIGLAPFAAAVWITPTLAQLGWLFLVACFATAGHLSMTKAFAAAPVTVTQPVTFLQLVWAVTIGAMLFGEPIDGWVIIGGLVIMTSVSFISWREAVLKKRAQPTPAVPNV